VTNLINKIHNIDCIDGANMLEDKSVQCIITSPPYWGLRDYGSDKQLGTERTPDGYVQSLCDVFSLYKRVLKDDGVLFVNIADSYFRNGGKPKGANNSAKVGNTKKGIQRGNCKVPDGYLEKSLALVPQKFVIEMSNRGWIVRNAIVWHKPNAMPQAVNDRFINDYEMIYMFVKQKRYKFNLVKENITGKSRIKRAVWSINTKPSKSGHIAPFPTDLILPCVLSGSNPYDIILDPFMGSGTVAEVCLKNNRNYIGFEISKEYCDIANSRISNISKEIING
jgi:DNA modification methylase